MDEHVWVLLGDALFASLGEMNADLRAQHPDLFAHVDAIKRDPAHRPSWEMPHQAEFNFAGMRWADCERCAERFVSEWVHKHWRRFCSQRCARVKP